ncbi:hypothetical protein Tco_0129489 [Tanacetum coccineum]
MATESKDVKRSILKKLREELFLELNRYIKFAPQLHESAGGLLKTKLVSHSCSLAGSTSAMKVSNWGGHLHFREVGERQVYLEALGAGVTDEDANHKFLRSLPPAWDSLAMTMRTKKNIDTLSIDDLYNNLSVFEQDIQKTSSSSLTTDNVAFLSQAKASSSKHKPSHSSGTTNADDVDLIHEDLDQIDDLDLEEMDINWQIAMTARGGNSGRVRVGGFGSLYRCYHYVVMISVGNYTLSWNNINAGIQDKAGITLMLIED